MEITDDKKVFIDKVIERCKLLVKYHIWDGIEPYNLDGWLQNFSSDEQKFFASLVLDKLIYRSNKQMISMLFDLFTINLPNAMRLSSDPLYNPEELLLTKLCQNGDCKIRLVNVDPLNNKSQSSEYVLHQLRHNLGISSNFIIRLENISQEYDKGVRSFILIDDIICTGTQMNGNLKQIEVSKIQDAKIYVAVCCAHQKGLDFLRPKYSNVKFVYTEHLTENDNLFSAINGNEKEELWKIYEDILDSKKVNLTKGKYGIGNLALDYAFESSTPNSCLPLLYFKNDFFNPLLKKRGS